MPYRYAPFRYAMPIVEGRGSGLGNEMIVWAKAYIASRALGLTVLHPAWGLNRRGYRDYFGTSRLDWAGHRLFRTALPYVAFTEADYRRLGAGDLTRALHAFADERGLHGRRPLVLGLTGLWGGYAILREARTYLRAQLLATRGTLANLHTIERRLGPERLRVALHIRRGDFATPPPDGDYRGRFNVAIPIDWHVATARNLAAAFGKDIVFLLVSDATPGELAPLTAVLPCVTTADLPRRDVSDLLALADSDLILGSISSFSLAAMFLSGAPYGWFAPHLTERGGFLSIWGHEPAQQAPDGETRHAAAAMHALLSSGASPARRGHPIDADGTIPPDLIAELARTIERKRAIGDLLHYGVAPA